MSEHLGGVIPELPELLTVSYVDIYYGTIGLNMPTTIKCLAKRVKHVTSFCQTIL